MRTSGAGCDLSRSDSDGYRGYRLLRFSHSDEDGRRGPSYGRASGIRKCVDSGLATMAAGSRVPGKGGAVKVVSMMSGRRGERHDEKKGHGLKGL